MVHCGVAVLGGVLHGLWKKEWGVSALAPRGRPWHGGSSWSLGKSLDSQMLHRPSLPPPDARACASHFTFLPQCPCWSDLHTLPPPPQGFVDSNITHTQGL